MRIGNICHMDIIADAGAIRRFIVVAIDGHCCPFTRGTEHAWNQVWLWIVRLSDDAIGIVAPAALK